MRAARLHSYHQPLKLEEVQEPLVTGPFDVIVRIGGAGLCRTDLHIVEGQWAEKTGVRLPYILGHENAGWVHEVGNAVESLEIGDAVIVHPLITCGECSACRGGDDMHCDRSAFPGVTIDGGFAELLRTNARAVIKLEPTLHPKDVAALADAGLTAYRAVKKAVPLLHSGSMVVVIGAGGLGHIGIQTLVAMTPAQVIVVDPSRAALDLATTLGAHHTVPVDGKQVEGVLELTDGRGAEVVLDFVGERGTTLDAVAMLRRGGSYFVIGYGENLNIPTMDIIFREINIIGNLVGRYSDLQELMSLTSLGKVRLHTRTYPLEALNDSMADLERGDLSGRGIIVPFDGPTK